MTVDPLTPLALTMKPTSTIKAPMTTTTTTTTTSKRDNSNKSHDTHSKCHSMTANTKVAIANSCKDIVQNELNMTTAITRNHHLPQQQQQHQQLQQQQQLDKMSIHSISSEDISTTVGGKCCSAAARNPAIKTGRRIQLLQVIVY